MGEKKAKRFRFVQDDYCHWYAIPEGDWTAFEAWVLSFEEGAPQWTGADFNEFRLDSHPSHYTVLDLQRIP